MQKTTTTKEEFALAALLESIEDGDTATAQAVLKRINETGLEVIVRERESNS